jgi:hypothetical protein
MNFKSGILQGTFEIAIRPSVTSMDCYTAPFVRKEAAPFLRGKGADIICCIYFGGSEANK